MNPKTGGVRVMINKDPIYQQLNRLLRQKISSDEYQVGDKFLTERMILRTLRGQPGHSEQVAFQSGF